MLGQKRGAPDDCGTEPSPSADVGRDPDSGSHDAALLLFGACALALQAQGFQPGCTLPFDAFKGEDLKIDAQRRGRGGAGFGPQPPGATSFFIGDELGGTGWEVPQPDGSTEKVLYFDLPEEIGTNRGR